MIQKLFINVFLMCLAVAANAQITFQKLSLEEAKHISAATDKLIFIDFRADWCKPCLEMEKTTFKDAEVGNVINAGFIPITADVDFFEWMDVQEFYNISVLPTLLILDKNGDVQQRIIGQKTAKALLDELIVPNNYDSTENEIETKERSNDDSKENETSVKDKPCFLKRWFRK